MDFFNTLGQGINNVVGFFQPGKPTQDLPKGMVSPIPKSQIVPHQAPSAYQQAVNNVQNTAGAIGNGIHAIASFPGEIGGALSNFEHSLTQGFNRPQPQVQAQAPQRPITPTPTSAPGEEQFVADLVRKNGGNPAEYHQLYRQAINSPGWSGRYYGQPAPTATATPTPTPSPYQQAQTQFNVNSVPNTPLPTGINQALNYVSQFVPGGQDPRTYYPALADPQFMAGIMAADKQKPGLGNVLLMQAFHESTLGRNGNNAFGVLPGGEGSGRSAAFQSLADSLKYQLGPNVLGGGGNPNMNIMNEPGPLTARRLAQLYQSYNPEGAYIKQILAALQQ